MRHLLALLLAGLLMAGCGGDPDGQGPGTDPDGGPGTTNPDGGSGGDGGGGSGPDDLPFPEEDACHEVTEQASVTRKPVDIIMVIDNSGSMSAEIEGVERNINESFAQIIEESGVDYRVILIARHGSYTNQNVCIREPLSGTNCNPIPSNPVNGPRFFHHNVSISSTNALSRLVETFPAWSDQLRPNSFKTIIVVTDDESRMTPDDFERDLFNLGPEGTFGNAEERNYVLHSIIGIEEKDPSTEAYGPEEPLVDNKCSSAARAGVRYETLSRRTGGLRFPVCAIENYDAVFRAAAQDVIERGRVACEFMPPSLPPGQTYDQAYVVYTPSTGGEEQLFLQVPDVSECNAESFTRDPSTNLLTLCPATCGKLEADEEAGIAVRFSCKVHLD